MYQFLYPLIREPEINQSCIVNVDDPNALVHFHLEALNEVIWGESKF